MISAVIVNFYTDFHTSRLIENLQDSEEISEILVVDNSRTLLDCKAFKRVEKKLKIKVLRPRENLGYGRGVNAATDLIRNPYILVLNPDLRLLPGCIKSLLQTAENYRAVLVGPRFYWDENKTFRLPPAEGMSLFWMWGGDLASRLAKEAEIYSYYWQARHEFFWKATEPFIEIFLSGAGLLLRKDFFKNQPIFDPQFFLYFEDVDLCLRVRDRGGLILCNPRAEAIHFWNQSPAPSETKQKYFYESKKLFLKKHYSLSSSVDLLPSSLIKPDFQPKVQNLGQFRSTISLPLNDLPQEEPLFIEIALNPWFVPFAQAVIKEPLELKESFARVWQYLGKGRYFLRIKNLNYQRLALWCFEKT